MDATGWSVHAILTLVQLSVLLTYNSASSVVYSLVCSMPYLEYSGMLSVPVLPKVLLATVLLPTVLLPTVLLPTVLLHSFASHSSDAHSSPVALQTAENRSKYS